MSSEAPPTWEQFDALYARIERAEAALAVARERDAKQKALLRRWLRGHSLADLRPDGSGTNLEAEVRAALVDEPAAATVLGELESEMAAANKRRAAAATFAEPGHRVPRGVAGTDEAGRPAQDVDPRESARVGSPGSASAAADELREALEWIADRPTNWQNDKYVAPLRDRARAALGRNQ